jgi:putative membrane protein
MASLTYGAVQRVNLPIGECGVLAVASLVAWLVDRHPAMLPVWAPWDFSWSTFLAVGFTLLWFLRGHHHASPAEKMSWWRCGFFLAGLTVIYVVLLTRFEYLAQHMFFLNRVQHAVLHHVGPFLIALSWPEAAITRGMPLPLRRLWESVPAGRAMHFLQQPLLAVVLFEGLLLVWLLPPVMFRAMLDARLYAIMNASMVVDGLLFWFLVLDPRPSPPVRIGFFPRMSLAFVIIFPQIAAGTLIGLARTDLYPTFALCGRVFPDISPLIDQQIGGLVLWVPAGMMSAWATVLIMQRLFRHDDSVMRARVQGSW